MPAVEIDDTLCMHYELDRFVEPWRTPETILLLHGIGGCTTEWYAWVPLLARKYSVIRVDLRGWGKSTVPPEGYDWSMDNFASDIAKFMDKLGLAKVHLVGTKLGGRIALHFARDYPQKLHSVTLVSTPMTISTLPNETRDRRPTVAGGRQGVEQWARRTMKERLGAVSPEQTEWWIQLYSSHSPRVVSEVFDLAWFTDERAVLPKIGVPTLVIDADVLVPIEETRQWQRLIPDSRLAVIPVTNEGRQLSASKPQECVSALLEFLDELSRRNS